MFTSLLFVTVTLICVGCLILTYKYTDPTTWPLLPINIITTDGHTPTKAHDQDAGFDLRTTKSLVIPCGKRRLAPTGVHIDIPDGAVADIRPRSGLAHKHGITVLNTPGTIDPGYTGEIMVNLINFGDKPVRIAAGDRIAQLVILPTLNAEFHRVNAFPTHARGNAGHGSTGK